MQKTRIMHIGGDYIVQAINDFGEWEDVVSKPTLEEAKQLFNGLKGGQKCRKKK